MFGTLLKKHKKTIEADWRFVQTDIHSHILPGIDDGAQNIEDSLALIKIMHQNGYNRMVATPHISEDIYPNKKETIFEKRDLIREKVAEKGWDIQIDAAAEYMMDGQFVELVNATEPLLTIQDNLVLVEMSYLLESPYLNNALFAMQTAGYQPLLAHPERYNFYHNDLKKYDELKERGCLFQLNTIAFSGYYGKHVKKAAEYLLNKGMYDYCGSDIHHQKHANALNSLLGGVKTIQLLQEYGFKNIQL